MTISVCMIVRNEARMLADALRSLRPLKPHEVICLDTGSTDNTPEIARNYGARVIHWSWQDDFAAARNESIRHASGDWILAFDADHRLVRTSCKPLRQFTSEQNRYHAARCSLHEATTLTASIDDVMTGKMRQHAPWQPCCLFKRIAPDGLSVAQYTGIIHESPHPWLDAHGMGECPAIHDFDIVHYGGIREWRIEQRKDDRNLALLARRIELEPNDVEPYGYLALIYYTRGDYDQARAIVDRAVQCRIVEREKHGIVRVFLVRALLALKANDPFTAEESAAAAGDLTGDNPDVSFIRGMAREMGGMYAEAIPYYLHALSLHGQPFSMQLINGATTWNSRARMGLCLAQMGQLDGADAALTHAREDGEGDGGYEGARAIIETEHERIRAARENDPDRSAPRCDPAVLGAQHLGASDRGVAAL